MLYENVARVAHEVNRAYCKSALGDYSQPPWDEAPEWQKESAIGGVVALAGNPNMTPEESHVSWMATKQTQGWKYGPVKDPERKEHPCMVPYNELPLEQRVKDHLFTAVVRAVLEVDSKENGEGLEAIGVSEGTQQREVAATDDTRPRAATMEELAAKLPG